LPKQSTDFKAIASLRSARNDRYKITLNEYKNAIDQSLKFVEIAKFYAQKVTGQWLSKRALSLFD